jgi:ferredoxin
MTSSRLPAILVLFLCLAPFAFSLPQSPQFEYERPVDIAPSEEDIGEDYVTPAVQRVSVRSFWLETFDVILLVVAMCLGTWIVLGRRSRRWLVPLTIGCLAYFGFYRNGCVCPIGAIQNITVSFIDPHFAVSYSVIAFFMFPLVAALFVGRAFCGGVCPLGAIQELVVLAPVQVPRRLDKILGSLKYIYLSLAIFFATLPAMDRDFIICRFDPFVGFFRGDGPAHMLMIGGGILLLGVFVGRPFCRYLCPYGVLLSIVSRFSWKGVTITPSTELDCGLCLEACPYGAIENMRAIRSSCLFCARCYNACPRHRVDVAGITVSTPGTAEPTQ